MPCGLHLHLGTLYNQTTHMTWGRHLGTAAMSPQAFGYYCLQTNPFLSLHNAMSDFMALSTDASLWDPVTKAKWGSPDFCPIFTTFHMWVIKQAQLNALSQVGAWEDVEKPQQVHGIPNSSAKHHHQVLKGLWPHCSVGTSPPNLLWNSRGGTPADLYYWQT